VYSFALLVSTDLLLVFSIPFHVDAHQIVRRYQLAAHGFRHLINAMLTSNKHIIHQGNSISRSVVQI
jgi:hypothetical protein